MGYKAKQLDLFGENAGEDKPKNKPKERSGLEDIADASVSSSKIDITKNNKPHYSIKKADLEKLSYPTLESIFYAMNYAPVPGAILSAMNPHEIIGLYIGIDMVKRRGTKEADKILDGNLPAEIVISKLVGIAYNLKDYEIMAKRAKQIYSSKPKQMQKRISMAPQEEKDLFLETLRKPRGLSNREDPVSHIFYDPNCDGNSRKVYINEIHRRI